MNDNDLESLDLDFTTVSNGNCIELVKNGSDRLVIL